MTLCPPDPAAADTAASVELSLYRLIVEHVADVIIRGDAQRRRTYVSPSAREMLGYAPAELMGGTALELVHPDDRSQAQSVLTTLGPAHPLLSLVFRMRRRDQSYIWVEARYRHIAEDGGVLAVLRDITARKNAEDQLAEANGKLAAANAALETMAHRDGLTGLANRRCFDSHLLDEFGRARRQAQPLGLVLLDVDHFKLYNDRYGHLAGDDCLRRVGDVIARALHRPGDLAARYGGEEIAAILPVIDGPRAATVAEDMRQAVAALAIEHRSAPLGVVTLSAGASALIPDALSQPTDLIAAADRALYRAKAVGRNCVCVG